jgi:hypothetical protein
VIEKGNLRHDGSGCGGRERGNSAKVTSCIGPLPIGAITGVTASQKAGMAVLVVFFVTGLALLMRVRD